METKGLHDMFVVGVAEFCTLVALKENSYRYHLWSFFTFIETVLRGPLSHTETTMCLDSRIPKFYVIRAAWDLINWLRKEKKNVICFVSFFHFVPVNDDVISHSR